MDKRQFIEICKKLYERKYVVGSGGNVSVREGNRVYLTPTGSILGFLKEDDIAEMDLDGNIIKGKPTSEKNLHLMIYRKRDDVNAIIHTHSLVSTFLSTINKEIDLLTPEGKIFLKRIGYVDYFEAGSLKLAEETAKRDEDVIILKNHGVVCLGKDLIDAYVKVEVLEEQAKLTLLKLLVKE
ncbi:L-fuculose phosphate aldolase [Methanocaldococcus fervens]|uniref:L-fuculose phosphate aldolase n=1 Tax=Methanocaldococcus fervens (strain DSM 4213 / JCM 15782 / AG86) TaxID=573064 RepID=C7P5X5_METFA|nr:L-fuculose phosphate aldolase [Methanocaldococcus fervens]ACV23957.1 class II aldolase/adducin family protein [Methanocaldococcus fervens AG86]